MKESLCPVLYSAPHGTIEFLTGHQVIKVVHTMKSQDAYFVNNINYIYKKFLTNL